MVVQHNMQAANANRMLNVTTSAQMCIRDRDNIEESIHFYNELFGLNVISRQEGNVCLLYTSRCV